MMKNRIICAILCAIMLMTTFGSPSVFAAEIKDGDTAYVT